MTFDSLIQRLPDIERPIRVALRRHIRGELGWESVHTVANAVADEHNVFISITGSSYNDGYLVTFEVDGLSISKLVFVDNHEHETDGKTIDVAPSDLV